MAKNKTTVTHADGSVSKRSSESRTYSHAVVLTETRESIAAMHRRNAAKHTETAAGYAAAAEGAITLEQDGSLNDYMGVRTMKYVGGIFTGSIWTGGKNHPADEVRGTLPTDDEARAIVRQSGANMRDYAAREIAAAEKAEAGSEFRYSVLRWSSREDLAVKALGEFDRLRGEGVTLTVVPVDAK